MKNTTYSNLSNKELYIKYQESKVNFRNAIEGSQEEIEADRIFTELSQEIENREDFNWLSFKNEELNNTNNKKDELINDMELFLKEENLNNAIGLLDRYYQDTKNQNILNLMNDKYITGDMVVLANKNNCIQLESNFDIDNSKYIYYEYTLKGNNENVEIHEIKQLTAESIRNTINELKSLNIA